MGYLERSREDQMLFVYWRAVNDVFPNASDPTVIKKFIKSFGKYCPDCTDETLRHRLLRMKAEYMDDQRTTNEA